MPFSITIPDVGIATGCYYDDLDFTDVAGVKAYIASGFDPETGTVLLTRAMKIPGGTGFVVKSDVPGKYNIPVTTTKYMYANLLVGTLEETDLSIADGTSYTNYVLSDGDKGVGFYLPSDGKLLPANKAYLHIQTGTSAAKRSIGISFEDEEDGTTTGFISVKELNEGVSGKSVIYNLNGQHKQSLSKGQNIVDGKKILIK